MTLIVPKLRISTPTGNSNFGRGFYQLEEDALYVSLAAYPDPAPFFSYLESDSMRFDLDMKGRLMMIEINLPRRHWNVTEDITYPLRGKPADIRWTDFRAQIKSPKIFTDPTQQNVMLRFTDNKPTTSHILTPNILCQIGADSRLIALWVTDIVDDIGGHEIRAFHDNNAQATMAGSKTILPYKN